MRQILFMSSGVVIWALHFGAIYGLTGLACARGWQEVVPPGVALATVVAAILALAVLVAGWRRRAQFESWMTAGIAALALVAIVWEALPVLIVPICR
jgi:hypothetical protein